MEPPALHWQMDEILIDIREDNIRKHSPELRATLLKDHTMSRAKVVICKTPMAKRITKRTLVGYRPIKVNTRYFEDLINQIKNTPANFIEKVKRGKSFWKTNNNDNMIFNAIVGNPQYQEVNKDTSMKSNIFKCIFFSTSIVN